MIAKNSRLQQFTVACSRLAWPPAIASEPLAAPTQLEVPLVELLFFLVGWLVGWLIVAVVAVYRCTFVCCFRAVLVDDDVDAVAVIFLFYLLFQLRWRSFTCTGAAS